MIHPNSRKADQISREWHRDVRVKHKRKETAHKMTNLGEKIAWFRDQLEADVKVYTPQLAGELVELYLGRFDEELEQIKMKNQVGHRSSGSRQHASRHDAIEHSQKLERDEYEGCGLGKLNSYATLLSLTKCIDQCSEIPDLFDPKNLEFLRTWTGELRFLQNIKLKRFRRKDAENVSNIQVVEDEDKPDEKDMDTA